MLERDVSMPALVGVGESPIKRLFEIARQHVPPPEALRSSDRGRSAGRSTIESSGYRSLARLRRDQGRHAEARDLPARVYGWFTEGFDTPDLKKAKALLDTLDGP